MLPNLMLHFFYREKLDHDRSQAAAASSSRSCC
jgi:hypothetical protein